MATGGGPFEEGMNDQDLPNWSSENVDDRLNNMDWGGQPKKANRSSEKNKKKFGVESGKRVTNDISPESSPGVGRRRTKTPHTFPHSRYVTQMSVPEQAELEKLKQRINFSDLDQRSIGSDSQGRATAANNKRQLSENRKPFNFLPMQINTNKSKDAAVGPQKREVIGSAQCKELFVSALSNDLLQNCQVSEEDGRGESAMESSQIVGRLVQIRDYITKASSMREDLVEKNERSANVERLTHLINHLKEQEKAYMKFLQKILARENEEEDVRTINSAVGSGSVAESTSLNIDVQSEASDTTARDSQQEPMEEIENLKKQHDLLKRMLQQQEQLRALQGRQAALLALQHKAEQAIAVMDDSVVTETAGSLSGVSITSELNEELNDLIQRFHNQLRDSQPPAVPDNRRQAESLSLTREVSQSRNPSVSEQLPDEKVQLFSKMRVLQEKKQKMDRLLGELHTLRDQHLNNSSFVPSSASPQRGVDQRSTTSAPSAPAGFAPVVSGEASTLSSSVPYPAAKKLNEVRKRLNELRELVHYYEQTSDMMTDAVNENTKDEETEESEYDSEHGNSEPFTNIRNPQVPATWNEVNSNSNAQCVSNNRDGRSVNSNCEINNRSANIRALNMPPPLDCRYNREGEQGIPVAQGDDDEEEDEEAEEEGVSGASLSSRRSSLVDEAPEDTEFEQINRLMAAKQKLRQLQGLVAMVQVNTACFLKNCLIGHNLYVQWKNDRPFSADGNYRPLAKTRQQNISMQRQENLRWVSELSYVEEKEQWQEQINQLRKQLDFSVNICQTLMQDQQTLSCLLQTLLTGPYSVLPSNVASPQVHLIMHQLNQCYTQLTWQQNNVQRLKQMLNELMHQQNQRPEKPGSKERGSSASHPPSPSLFCPFSFPAQPVNLLNLPGFTNFSSFAPGMNFSPLFPSNFGDFSQNISTPKEQQQPLAQNSSGTTECMAFPKPFESSSSVAAEKQRNQKQPEEEVENSRTPWLYEQEGEGEKPFNKAGFTVSVEKTTNSHRKNQLDPSRRRRQFDEESLESFSSMPDPVDPTAVTKTFKTRKASAQASLASKDKSPKSKSKKRHSTQLKSRVKNIGYESASMSSTCEPCKSRNRHSAQTEEPVQAKVFSRKNHEQLEKIIKYSRSTEISSETGSDFSMFESLRDTIYSEVATLISQNESHPHFLIELFHELQLLNTDYLRQRALYALQDIVSRHISENHEKEGENVKSVNSGTWIASNSELTPSESLATTDDETFEKNFERETHKISEQNDADNASVMSVSSNFEPFATDDLGNTVIHLDQALARMREYERVKTEAEGNTDTTCSCRIVEDGDEAATAAAADDVEETPITENHSSQQPISEVSTIPCPRIDTQQLDRQIKAIMKEVIPFLKEHMDEVCSSQLLTSVRRMVLTLTQQNDESKEFVKFFHKQLGSILQDSLAKFAGRKLKDCGEDLLVEISEVLFNELAFFKLMQDLDNNSIAVKQRCKRKIAAAGVIQSYAKEAKWILEEDHGSPAGEVDDEDKDKDETETVKQMQTCDTYNSAGPKNVRSDVSDQEDDEESEEGPVSINLSKAETQALTNYGSGEDENEDEEIEEFEEGPVDVQTSLQANTDAAEENELDAQVLQQDLEKLAESKTVPSSEQEPTTSKDEQDGTPVKPCYLNILENEQPLNNAVQKDSVTTIDSSKQPNPLPLTEIETLVPRVKEVKSAQETPESSLAGSPDTESPVLVNDYEAESGNISQKSDEEDFVKVEDLPLKLTIYSEADLRKKMVEEQQKNHLSDEILCEMQTKELAGNSQMLKEPETVGTQSM
nr:pericentriolar material 1 protein [Manis javanica]